MLFTLRCFGVNVHVNSLNMNFHPGFLVSKVTRFGEHERDVVLIA